MPPYTNTATTEFDDKQSDSAKNCSLCTAAGVINLLQGGLKCRSFDVAKFFKSKDNKFGMGGGGFSVQTKSIMTFSQNNGAHVENYYLSKHSIKGIGLHEATKYMQKFKSRTVFALCVQGATQKGGNVIHWLNAVNVQNQIRYFDYQVCRDVSNLGASSTVNPASCLKPFVGVKEQTNVQITFGDNGVSVNAPSHKAFHGPNQLGVFKDNVQFMSIIAFNKK